MRFWLVLMAVPELDQLIALAQHAEACGFHGVTYADHLVMPTRISTPCPYSSSGEMFWPVDAPWPDPWIVLSVLGAATGRLRLATNIYLAALRDPFTVARAVSTAAALTGGRVVCGVSAGWLREEFDAAGVDFASRGGRLDELLAVCRKLWTGEPVAHDGAHFSFPEVIMRPAPSAPIPVWVGGASPPALRRAAANDGWLGLPMNVADNLAIVGRMRQMRTAMSLPQESFHPCISLTELLSPQAEAALETASINDMTVIPWMPTPWDMEAYVEAGADVARLDVKKAAISRFADRVISQQG